MKHLLVLLLTIGFVTAGMAQSRAIYTNPKFYSYARNHEKVAVLPFDVQIGLRPKEREKFTDQQLKDMEMNEGKAAQNALISWFYKKQKTSDFAVEFQDVQTTNALLLKAGIDAGNIESYTSQELAAILGVDAVIGGAMQTTKPISDGASVALGLAFGVYGPTNSGNVTINLTNAGGGELLWKYDKQLSRGLGSDMNLLMDTLMRKASRQFPYLDMDKHQKDAHKS